MKVLQLCYKMPYPLKDGGEYSIYNSALSLLLQPKLELKVLAMNTKKNWVDRSLMPKEYLTKTNFECIKVDTRIKPFNMFSNLFKSESYFIERFYSKSYRDKIVSLLQNESYDIIQLEHLYLCLYLKDIRSYCTGKVVLRTQNVEYNVWESYIKNHNNFFIKWYLKIATRRLKKFEISTLSDLDGIITLTEDDLNIYQKHAHETKIQSIPIGFDQSLLRNYNYKKQFEKPPIIYHIGSMDWLPNVVF